jgi:hypothetical protein
MFTIRTLLSPARPDHFSAHCEAVARSARARRSRPRPGRDDTRATVLPDITGADELARRIRAVLDAR